MVILAGKSPVFFLANSVAELTLFEHSNHLPEGLLGLPTLSEGSRVAVQLDNLTEGDITLIPEWKWVQSPLYTSPSLSLGVKCQRYLIRSLWSNREICGGS